MNGTPPFDELYVVKSYKVNYYKTLKNALREVNNTTSGAVVSVDAQRRAQVQGHGQFFTSLELWEGELGLGLRLLKKGIKGAAQGLRAVVVTS